MRLVNIQQQLTISGVIYLAYVMDADGHIQVFTLDPSLGGGWWNMARSLPPIPGVEP